MLNSNELALNLIDSAGVTRSTERREFFAMGTRFYFVVVDGTVDLLEKLELQTHEFESHWTRFSRDSELMKLNLANGIGLEVSSDTAELIQAMTDGYLLTDGKFNPSVLPMLIQHGFTTNDEWLDKSVEQSTAHIGDMTKIHVDMERRIVQLPQGMMLDAGGIGKGFAADLLADQAMLQGAKGIVVFAGGEVAVRGVAPGDGGWTIGVQNPWDPEDLLDVVEIAHGGIATSSTQARTVNDSHHLIDPNTGGSFTTDIVQATVLCDRATDAEVLTKACFAHNHEAALAMVEGAGAQALIVTADGAIYRSLGWEDYT